MKKPHTTVYRVTVHPSGGLPFADRTFTDWSAARSYQQDRCDTLYSLGFMTDPRYYDKSSGLVQYVYRDQTPQARPAVVVNFWPEDATL